MCLGGRKGRSSAFRAKHGDPAGETLNRIGPRIRASRPAFGYSLVDEGGMWRALGGKAHFRAFNWIHKCARDAAAFAGDLACKPCVPPQVCRVLCCDGVKRSQLEDPVRDVACGAYLQGWLYR